MARRDIGTILKSLERRFLSDRTDGWISVIHFIFNDAEPLTFRIEYNQLQIKEGLDGEPLSTVHTDTATFDCLFAGKAPLELVLMQNRFRTDNLVEIFKLQTVFARETE